MWFRYFITFLDILKCLYILFFAKGKQDIADFNRDIGYLRYVLNEVKVDESKNHGAAGNRN